MGNSLIKDFKLLETFKISRRIYENRSHRGVGEEGFILTEPTFLASNQ